MRNPYFRFNLYSFEYDFSFKDLNNDNIKDLVDNTTYIFNEPDTVNLIRQFLFNGKSFRPNPSISGFLSLKNKEDIVKINTRKDGKKQLNIYRNESLKYKSSFTFSKETKILDFAIGRIKSLNENFVYIKVEDEKWKTAYYWMPHKKRTYFRSFNKKSKKIISSKNLIRNEELNNYLLIIQSLITDYYNKPIM